MQTQQLQGVACLPHWLVKIRAAGQLHGRFHVHSSVASSDQHGWCSMSGNFLVSSVSVVILFMPVSFP